MSIASRLDDYRLVYLQLWDCIVGPVQFRLDMGLDHMNLATIGLPAQHQKLSLRDKLQMPLLAFLDRRLEDVRVEAVIIPELELGDIDRQIFCILIVSPGVV